MRLTWMHSREIKRDIGIFRGDEKARENIMHAPRNSAESSTEKKNFTQDSFRPENAF